MPTLSIITATFNSEKTLEETIESVLNQSYTDFEYILVDGNSKDGTLDIIKKYEAKFQERNISYTWKSEPDTGIYNAWNKGLKMTKGDWIGFLGSDDVYLEDALKKYTEHINANDQLDYVHSKVRLVDGGKVKFEYTDRWRWNQFKRQMKIAHVGSFHNRKYFEIHGNYDETFKIAGDYELLLRAKEQLKVGFIDDFTAEMKDGGISNNHVWSAFREARLAKIQSGNIGNFTAYIDFWVNISKYYISKQIKKLR